MHRPDAGWLASVGVQAEIRLAAKLGKPVSFLAPGVQAIKCQASGCMRTLASLPVPERANVVARARNTFCHPGMQHVFAKGYGGLLATHNTSLVVGPRERT